MALGNETKTQLECLRGIYSVGYPDMLLPSLSEHRTFFPPQRRTNKKHIAPLPPLHNKNEILMLPWADRSPPYADMPLFPLIPVDVWSLGLRLPHCSVFPLPRGDAVGIFPSWNYEIKMAFLKSSSTLSTALCCGFTSGALV